MALAFTTQDPLASVTSAVTDPRLSIWDYVIAVAIFAIALALGRLVRSVLKRIVDRSRTDNLLGDLIGRIAPYLVVTFGLIYALEKLGIAIGPILGALGIVGIALAFAFQNILENFVAGIILQLQRPFTSGDEIQSGDYEGAIISVDTRTITLETPDGETVRMPSAEVIKSPIVNHTQLGRRRSTIEIGVAYGTDLDFAAEVALDVLKQTDSVLIEPAPKVLVHGFGDSSIDYSVMYWHEPSISEEWQTRDIVARALARAFTTNGIQIPFPQRVVHAVKKDD